MMNKEQQDAWDIVYTASTWAPGSSVFLTREHALALVDMMAERGVTMQPVPSPETLDAIRIAMGTPSTRPETEEWRVYRALYDHLRKPAADAPRKVKVTTWGLIQKSTGTLCRTSTSKDDIDTRGDDRWARVELTGEYDAPEPPEPPKRTEWWITGHAMNGRQLYSETAHTEAERDSFYRSACGTAGVKRVIIDEREVEA